MTTDINSDTLTGKRYGKVRGTGGDTTPVLQLVTNFATFNLSLVPIYHS